MSAVRACAAIAAVASVAAGCAPQHPARYELLAAIEATAPIDGGTLYPLVEEQWSYSVSGEDQEITRRRSPTERFGATWMDQDGDRRSEFWGVDDEGNLSMTAVIDHSRGAVTFFDPPLVIAYAELEPGRRYEQQVAMRVMDADDIRRRRDSGTGTCVLEYVGDWLLQTPLGRITTRRIEVLFEARLRMAAVRTASTLYIVPGVGPAVSVRRERIQLLFVPVSEWSETQVLISAPPSVAAALPPERPR